MASAPSDPEQGNRPRNAMGGNRNAGRLRCGDQAKTGSAPRAVGRRLARSGWRQQTEPRREDYAAIGGRSCGGSLRSSIGSASGRCMLVD